MELTRGGVVVLLLSVIALGSASRKVVKPRVREATSLSESILALDELVKTSVLRSIISFAKIIKDEFEDLADSDVAKELHVKDRNVPISSAKLVALAEKSKDSAYIAIQDANRRLVNIMANAIARSQGSSSLLDKLGHHVNLKLKSKGKESVESILKDYDEDIQNILADVDSTIRDSFNDKFLLLSKSLAILLEGYVTKNTLQENGEAMAEYAEQAARRIVLQQTDKIKAVLGQALKHAAALKTVSPSDLGKEKVAILNAIQHVSSLKNDEVVFKYILRSAFLLRREYNLIHDKITRKV